MIRGIWDAAERRPLHAGGDYYRVDGAKRGPAPAHDIPIWIGAYKPRMLGLTARKADGWLPSLPYLQPGDLQRGNRLIDQAATKAGRDPREITRLLNVTADQSAEDLARLALQDGISTFIVMGDDPDGLRRFAAEIAPAVREQVDQNRGTPAPGRIRNSIALAKRRAGIDYDALPASLAAAPSNQVTPGTPGTPPATCAVGRRDWSCARSASRRSATRWPSRGGTGTSRWGSSAPGTDCPAAR